MIEKALKKQNYDEALGYVEKAFQKKPEDAKAFEVQGRIYQGMAALVEEPAEYVALLGQMMEAFHQAASLDSKMAEKVKNTLTLAYITQFQRGIEVFNEAQSTRDKNGYLQSASSGPGQLSPFRRVAYRWLGPLRLVLCVFRNGKVTKETRSGLFGKNQSLHECRFESTFIG